MLGRKNPHRISFEIKSYMDQVLPRLPAHVYAGTQPSKGPMASLTMHMEEKERKTFCSGFLFFPATFKAD